MLCAALCCAAVLTIARTHVSCLILGSQLLRVRDAIAQQLRTAIALHSNLRCWFECKFEAGSFSWEQERSQL